LLPSNLATIAIACRVVVSISAGLGREVVDYCGVGKSPSQGIAGQVQALGAHVDCGQFARILLLAADADNATAACGQPLAKM